MLKFNICMSEFKSLIMFNLNLGMFQVEVLVQVQVGYRIDGGTSIYIVVLPARASIDRLQMF